MTNSRYDAAIVSGDDDIVQWVLREVCARVPVDYSAAILEVELLARTHWGGAYRIGPPNGAATLLPLLNGR